MAAAPQGYDPNLSLGGASFVLGVDDDSFKQKLIKAEQAARQASAGIGNAFGKGGDAARALLQFGQIVDDAQYGFRGIVNNIPMFIQSMGMGAGVAGVVGIAAVAINQLVNHTDALGKLFERGHTSAESARMRELADETERAAKAAERLRESRPAGEVAAAKATERVISEGPGADIERSILKALTRRQAGMASTFEGGEGSVRETFLGRLFTNIKGALGFGGQEDVSEDIKREATDLFGAMATDIQARKVVMALAQQFPDLFPHGFGANLKATTPDEFAKLNRDKQLRKLGHDMQDRIQKGEDELGRKLTEQGRGIEEQMFGEREEQIRKMEKDLQFRRERISDVGTSQVFGSGHQFANNIMTDALNGPRNKQLDEIKRTNQKLDEMKEILRRDRQAARFAR